MLHLLGENSVSCAGQSFGGVSFCVTQLWEGGTWELLEILGKKVLQ